MTRVAYSREDVEIDGRAMTRARRARILAKFNHRCAYPGCGVTDGLEIDHTIPLALGGKDDDENMTALCGPHHKAKTRLDLKMIARAKRQSKMRLDRPRESAAHPIPHPKSPWPPKGSRKFGR